MTIKCLNLTRSCTPRVIACLLLVGCGSEVVDNSELRQSAVVSSLRHDAGPVIEGAEINHRFLVRNTTARPFSVKRVERPCSCLNVTVQSGGTVQCGECVPVDVRLATKGMDGRQEKSFIVITDADEPEYARIELTLVAKVVRPLKSIPSQIAFGNIAASLPATQRLDILEEQAGLLRTLKRFESSNPDIDLKLQDRRPGAIVFEVSIKPSCPHGSVTGMLRFLFDNDKVPELDVPCMGMKTGDLVVVPRRLELMSAPIAATDERHLRILSLSRKQFRIKRIRSDADLVVDFSPTKEPRSVYEMRVTFGHQASSLQSSVIRVETDRIGEETIVIPVLIHATADAKSQSSQERVIGSVQH